MQRHRSRRIPEMYPRSTKIGEYQEKNVAMVDGRHSGKITTLTEYIQGTILVGTNVLDAAFNILDIWKRPSV